MKSLQKVIPLLFSSAAYATQNSSITWVPCANNATVPLMCSTLAVPLDYTNPQSNATINLELVKVPAAIQPSKGSILLNPGGPGIQTNSFVSLIGQALLTLTGGHHDLIGFNPRGTGNTLTYTCFQNQSDIARIADKANLLLNASDVAMGETWGWSGVISDACYEQAKDIGSLVGTGFVARDMAQIVDALGEDGLLRYWGFSYGTVLGATFAAMFPNKVDKVILDGVVNVHEYYSGFDLEKFTDMDNTWDGFISACMAAPNRCLLSQHASSEKELRQILDNLLVQIKYHPIVVGKNLLTYSMLKGAIAGLAMYAPTEWPSFSDKLNGLLLKNETAIEELWQWVNESSEAGIVEANLGITCGEKVFRTDDVSSMKPVFDKLADISWMGGDIGPFVLIACARWKMEAKGRYLGDFKTATKNPVLLIGNTYDPVTPLISARNVSSGFEGSVVLEQHGYGHSSLAQFSTCTMQAVQSYFINGTLPKEGTVCDVDATPFSVNQKRSLRYLL